MASNYAIEYRPNLQTELFILWPSMRSRPKPGARIVFFKRQNKDIVFVSWATVADALDTPEEGAAYLVAAAQQFDKPRSLKVLGGSLQKTRRFLDPGFHFKRQLVALSDSDFDTIINDKPDIARSVFRFLFHALPLVVQSAFVQEHAELFPRQQRQNYEYDRLADALVLYLEQRIGEAIQLTDQFVRTYPIDIPKFPMLADLRVSSGDTEDAIPFGKEVLVLAEFGRTSPLFNNTNGGDTLLAECRKQLSSTVSTQERRRRWTDLIF